MVYRVMIDLFNDLRQGARQCCGTGASQGPLPSRGKGEGGKRKGAILRVDCVPIGARAAVTFAFGEISRVPGVSKIRGEGNKMAARAALFGAAQSRDRLAKFDWAGIRAQLKGQISFGAPRPTLGEGIPIGPFISERLARRGAGGKEGTACCPDGDIHRDASAKSGIAFTSALFVSAVN